MRTLSKPNNVMVRNALKNANMCQWQLAELVGVTEVTITRWFRHELPEDEQKRLCEIIKNGRK